MDLLRKLSKACSPGLGRNTLVLRLLLHSCCGWGGGSHLAVEKSGHGLDEITELFKHRHLSFGLVVAYEFLSHAAINSSALSMLSTATRPATTQRPSEHRYSMVGTSSAACS